MFGNKEKKIEKLVEKRDVAKLCEFLEDPETNIVLKTIQGLGQITGTDASANALVPLMRRKDKMVQIEAIHALAKVGDKSSMTHIAHQMKNEKDPEVLAAMAKALEAIKAH